MASEVTSVRAGYRQVTDVSGIVAERSFRSSNGRLVSFRPETRFNSSDFSDLPKNLSPHGGTVEMPRNAHLQQAQGPAKGHVCATVDVGSEPGGDWIVSRVENRRSGFSLPVAADESFRIVASVRFDVVLFPGRRVGQWRGPGFE
jgi:hypothetical protein